MEVTSLREPKMADRVATVLRRMFIRGEIPEGTMLPPESELMERFGVSRPTLREAFRVLESESLIEVQRGVRGGARVTRPRRETLARYAGRILNIHPGPLPDFGGEGMYGRRVHEAVLAAGVAQSGVVIHLVDEEYDHGAPVARAVVPIQPGDTAADLEARVRAIEPGFFVETLQKISRGEISLPA